ncbi:exodeoxyribonuclease VII small subunit [Megalodesulfovibrio gigas]|uniref:Exodeoxyribonuclease 7 small subunit n=1 Tax=Megalodesulfovibrio gigas (strain ATCC 19364 / DSM 1382 / NCIMB 9332 / VKM B-1759) TaxID=1121448 RepID=T2GEG8_MEGG1|nr:exodeoxyribonuclease VII small subunit [Megalodesulfovibrio gigas]AGW14526.1 putative exonuclease VII small subunit [Megalodesulfovibrio gigas DSM 1382 = ATCC 19364]
MTQATPRDTFEARATRLKEVVAALEKPDVPLEEAVALYKEGLTLARDCRQRLEQARHEVELLTREGQPEAAQ